MFLSRNITPLTIRKHGTVHLATIEYNEENELSILNAPLVGLSSQIPIWITITQKHTSTRIRS